MHPYMGVQRATWRYVQFPTKQRDGRNTELIFSEGCLVLQLPSVQKHIWDQDARESKYPVIHVIVQL